MRPEDRIYIHEPGVVKQIGIACVCCDRVVVTAENAIVAVDVAPVCKDCWPHLHLTKLGECDAPKA